MTSEFDRFVHLALPGRSEYVVAGRFRRRTPGDQGAPFGEFVYGRRYLKRPDAVEIDPVNLRLTARVRRAQSGFFGALRDAIPNTWGRFVVAKGNAIEQPRSVNDHAGALAFARGLEVPPPKRQYNTVDDLARIREALEATPDQSETLKASVVDADHTLWLAKFVPPDDMHAVRIRQGLLRLAGKCGLHIIRNRVERVGGGDVLLVHRADRAWTGDGYSCSRVISGLTIHPARRKRSYLVVADEIRRASSHPRADLREFFGRLCFNAAISNTEDDLQRPILFADGNSWRLAPATGPIPTLGEGYDDQHSMAVGPAGRTVSRENIVAGAGRFLLSRDEAAAIYDHTFDFVGVSWYSTLRECGVSVQDCDLVSRLIRPR